MNQARRKLTPYSQSRAPTPAARFRPRRAPPRITAEHPDEACPSTAPRAISSESDNDWERPEHPSSERDSNDAASETGSQGSLGEGWEAVDSCSVSPVVQNSLPIHESGSSDSDVGHSAAPSTSSDSPAIAAAGKYRPLRENREASSSTQEGTNACHPSTVHQSLFDDSGPGDSSISATPEPAQIRKRAVAGKKYTSETERCAAGSTATSSLSSNTNRSYAAKTFQAAGERLTPALTASASATMAGNQRAPPRSDHRPWSVGDAASSKSRRSRRHDRHRSNLRRPEQDAAHDRHQTGWPGRDGTTSWRRSERTAPAETQPVRRPATPSRPAVPQSTELQQPQQLQPLAIRPAALLNPRAPDFVPKSISAARQAHKGHSAKVGEASDSHTSTRSRDGDPTLSASPASASGASRIRAAERRVPVSFGSSRQYESILLPEANPVSLDHDFDPAWHSHRADMVTQATGISQANIAGPSTFALPNRLRSPFANAADFARTSDDESHGPWSSASESHGDDSDSGWFGWEQVQYPHDSSPGCPAYDDVLAASVMPVFDAPTVHTYFHHAGSSEYRSQQQVVAAQQAYAAQEAYMASGAANGYHFAQDDEGWNVVGAYEASSSSSMVPYQTLIPHRETATAVRGCHQSRHPRQYRSARVSA